GHVRNVTGLVDKGGAVHMFSVSTCCSLLKRHDLRVQLKLMTVPTTAAEHDWQMQSGWARILQTASKQPFTAVDLNKPCLKRR
ncbi:MAG: hypothetical protein ACXVI5_08180, partial [Halobacteriota archaeon]